MSSVPHRSKLPGHDPAAERSRILRCFQAAAERDGKPWAPRPYDDREIRAAADLGSCSPWPTDDELTAEFCRTIDGAKAKDLDPTLGFCLNHIGEEWKQRKQRAGVSEPLTRINNGQTEEWSAGIGWLPLLGSSPEAAE
jgi:hypothetical protein